MELGLSDSQEQRPASAGGAGGDATRAPVLWSGRACDGMVVALGSWTVACNAVVWCEGGLRHLTVTYLTLVGLAAAGYLLWRRLRTAPRPEGRGADPGGTPEERQEEQPGDAELLPASAGTLTAMLVASLAITAAAALGLRTLHVWWLVAGYLLVVVGTSWNRPALPVPAASRPRMREGALGWLALAGGLVPLFAHKPGLDDALYVNFAASALDAPLAPLLKYDTLHGVPDLLILLPTYRINSYELLGAFVAFVGNLQAIQACHLVLPALAGVFVVLAYAQLARLLTPRTWWGTLLAALAILLWMGECHRSYGNTAFLRLQHGKAVFAAVLVPLLMVYGVRFARRPTLRSWGLLCLVQVASAGMTATGLWAAPMLAALAVASGCSLSRQGIKTLVLGLAASFYLVLLGLVLRDQMTALHENHQVPQHWSALMETEDAEDATEESSDSLLGESIVRRSVHQVLGTGPVLLLSLFATLTAGVLLNDRRGRRLALLVPLGVAVTLLNPYLAAVFAADLTGPSTHYRVMWILPITAFLAVLLTTPLRLPAAVPRLLRGGATVLFVVAALALAPRVPTLSAENGVHWAPFGWKVPPEFEASQALVNLVPRGERVLAPIEVAMWVGTLQQHPSTVVARKMYLRIQAARLSEQEVSLRESLQRLVTGRRQETVAPMKAERVRTLWRKGVRELQIGGVGLAPDSPYASQMRELLGASRFHLATRAAGYEIWIRTGPTGDSSP